MSTDANVVARPEELESLLGNDSALRAAIAPQADIVASKVFSWGQLFAGDCVQINGTLTLQSNGIAHFTSVVWTNTTHSGDYWWSGFEFLDGNQVSLGSERYHTGPRMDDGNGGPSPRYYFNFDFNFNPAIYNTVAYVRQGYKC